MSSPETLADPLSFDLDLFQYLRPTTSLSTNRYDKTPAVTPSHTVISPGLFRFNQDPEPMYLPPNWSAYIHPEGQQYFYRDSKLRIVTEAYLYRSETMERISYWSHMIEDLLSQKNIPISDDMELFLQLDDDSDSCAYYLIDHSSRTEFWIDALPTDILDLPSVISISHLKHALEEHYWTHVERFPAHFGGLPHQAVDDLIATFSHGQADHLTSSVSTFPYTAAECSKFLDLLGRCRGEIENASTTCFVARLWGTVARNRSIASQDYPNRLSRDHILIDDSVVPLTTWLERRADHLKWQLYDSFLDSGISDLRTPMSLVPCLWMCVLGVIGTVVTMMAYLQRRSCAIGVVAMAHTTSFVGCLWSTVAGNTFRTLQDRQVYCLTPARVPDHPVDPLTSQLDRHADDLEAQRPIELSRYDWGGAPTFLLGLGMFALGVIGAVVTIMTYLRAPGSPQA